MNKALKSFYGSVENKNTSNIKDLGFKYSKALINSFLITIFLIDY
jgi:hypothetical protein